MLEGQSAVCFKSNLFRHSRYILRAAVQTLRGYLSTSPVLFFSFIQILSAFQRQEPARRHATGPHRSLLGLIKTLFFFFFVLGKKKKKREKEKIQEEKKKTLHSPLKKRTMRNNKCSVAFSRYRTNGVIW